MKFGLQPKAINDPDANQFFSSELGSAKSISELIRFGADWEDGRGEKLQATRHFFNPVTNEALNAGPFVIPVFPFIIPKTSGIRSPDWALEDTASKYDGLPDALLPQKFSYRQGRKYFMDALTAQGPDLRNENWGLTFQTLGHVIHHLQDMAQPQHTRNDFHCDAAFCEGTGLLGGIKPSFEKWTLNNPDSGQYQGYEPVYTKDAPNGFAKPRDFWQSAGRGIAEFSNRNFFTAGTNAGTGAFASPRLLGSTPQKIDIAILCNESVQRGREPCPANLQGNMTFYATNVTDELRAGQGGINTRATSRSLFDADLKRNALFIESYSVNRFTYDATNDFTLKRAVGYSAGLINYFFRGDIDLVDDPAQPGTYAIENKSGEAMSGTFGLYYDTAVADARLLHKSWALMIPAGGRVNVGSIAAPTVPAPKIPGQYMLVFNGDMGEERAGSANVGAVAANVVNVSLSGFVVNPSYLPVDGTAGARHIALDGGGWKLSSGNGVMAGNIDWKGWYVGGRPTQVLSWSGPRARSIPDTPGNAAFGGSIFKDGKVFAVAPFAVLGAALTRDGGGEGSLVAITRRGLSDVVFRRPNRPSNSAALFHATTNPDGWLELGTRTRVFGPDRPYFFNGSGNEAQTVMIPAEGNGRIKMNLAGGGAVFSTIPFTSSIETQSYNNRPSIPSVVEIRDRCVDNGITVYQNDYYNGFRYDIRNENPLPGTLIAVDYRGDVEVLAESRGVFVSAGKQEDFRESLTTYKYPAGDRTCETARAETYHDLDPWEMRTEHYNKGESTLTDESAILSRLSIGSTTIDLPTTGHRITSKTYKSASVGQVTSQNITTGERIVVSPWVHTNEYLGLVNRVGSNAAVAYLDLRDQFYILYEAKIRDRLICQTENCSIGSQTYSQEEGVNIEGSPTILAIKNDAPSFNNRGFFALNTYDYDVGHARDVRGNRAYSLNIGSLSIDPFGPRKIFNFLSGGSFAGVIPAAPADATYFSIGLVR